MEDENRSQCLLAPPKGKDSFPIHRIEVLPLWAVMGQFFTGSGLQVDFEGPGVPHRYSPSLMVPEGACALWLTLTDAKALHANLEAVIAEVTRKQHEAGEPE